MTDTLNQQVFLLRRPHGMPQPADFGFRYVPIPDPGPGECLVRIEFLSVDPYMRGHMKGGVYRSMKPVQEGDTLYGGAVGRVVRSRAPELPEGQVVEGYLGWQQWAVVKPDAVRRVNERLAPISTALGVLGMPGMTAFFGMRDIAQPRAGETLVVSAAAGAVGSVAAQIGRIRGCRVIGIAGTERKTRHLLEDLRLHGAIDYKAVPDLHQALVQTCPDGIDIYFDNVGGATFDATTRCMKYGFRYVSCGQIAQYNDDQADIGPRNLKNFEVFRARLQGFGVLEYRSQYDEGIAQMSEWIRSGELVYREDIVDGLESAPEAFIGLLQGRNLGKQLVRVASPA